MATRRANKKPASAAKPRRNEQPQSIGAVNWLGAPRTLHILPVFQPRSPDEDRRGIPGRTAWGRLRELLGDAERDPEISASSQALSFLLALQTLVSNAIQSGESDGQMQSFAAVIREVDHIRMAQARKHASTGRAAAADKRRKKILRAEKKDIATGRPKHGRVKRIALDLGVANSTVSKNLKTNLR